MHIACRGLTFSYPGATRPVLENLCFEMAGPGFNAVFGPSGVGKTSFARLVAGGNYEDGQREALAFEGIDTILYSYNQERLPGWSATGNHIDKVCPQGKEDLKAELIRIFQVGPVLKSRFSQLSMGQQNRMNLIRYLIQDFDLLIMDESLANVDESLRETILLSIKDLFPSQLFLYISHNLMEVSRFCREILVLGRASSGRPASMIKGQDEGAGDSRDPAALDRTMLEIMNAV